jgi:hypothetical protein
VQGGNSLFCLFDICFAKTVWLLLRKQVSESLESVVDFVLKVIVAQKEIEVV